MAKPGPGLPASGLLIWRGVSDLGPGTHTRESPGSGFAKGGPTVPGQDVPVHGTVEEKEQNTTGPATSRVKNLPGLRSY